MRYGWLAAAGALLVAGCSAIESGSGRPVPAGTLSAPFSTAGAAPSSAPIARASGATATAPATAASGTTASTSPAPSTCAAVFFGVAGSGQGPQNPPPQNLPHGVTEADAHAYGTAVGLLKAELVTLAHHKLAATQAIDYPATGLPNWIGPGGLTANLDASEVQGVHALVAAIRAAEQGGCSGRPVLLAGYSQGAEVVIRAVDQLSTRQRLGVAVALFGNPSYQPGAVGDYPGTAREHGLRPALGGTGYYLPADVRGRTLDICASGDPVCGMSPAATTVATKLAYLRSHAYVHASAYAFGTAGYPKLAARFLWRHR